MRGDQRMILFLRFINNIYYYIQKMNQHQIINISFSLNKIFVIESLTTTHQSCAQDLFNYTISEKFRDCSPEYISIDSKLDLLNTLKKISKNIKGKNLYPLIHFEMHGLSSGMGLSLRNGDTIKWEELKPILNKINLDSHNNLILFLAACKSADIVKELVNGYLNPEGCSAPFFGFVAPSSNIDWENLYLSSKDFYINFALNRDFVSTIRYNGDTGPSVTDHIGPLSRVQ